MRARRRFTREFKVEAVRVVRERDMTVAKPARSTQSYDVSLIGNLHQLSLVSYIRNM